MPITLVCFESNYNVMLTKGGPFRLHHHHSCQRITSLFEEIISNLLTKGNVGLFFFPSSLLATFARPERTTADKLLTGQVPKHVDTLTRKDGEKNSFLFFPNWRDDGKLGHFGLQLSRLPRKNASFSDTVVQAQRGGALIRGVRQSSTE